MIAMRLPLAPAHNQALATRTEGWVVGMQLAALAMRDRTNIAEFILSAPTGWKDHLRQEVVRACD
jgi:ATP/maltotriose-dependent transcriptional regulator MalT